MQTEQELISACLALINGQDGLSSPEQKLINANPLAALKVSKVNMLRKAIMGGSDPLGDAFALIRSASNRRATGAV